MLQCFLAEAKLLISGVGTPYTKGAQALPCGGEIFNLGRWHPLQRSPKCFLTGAMFFIPRVGAPHKKAPKRFLTVANFLISKVSTLQRVRRVTLPKSLILGVGAPLKTVLASCHAIFGFGCLRTFKTSAAALPCGSEIFNLGCCRL